MARASSRILMLSLLIASAAVARADRCGITLTASNVLINWNQNFNFQAVTLSVFKKKKDACSIVLAFSRGGASDYNRRMVGPGGNLPYQLCKDSSLTQILKDNPDITGPSDAIQFSMPQGDNLTSSVTYYVQVPQNGATQPSYKSSGVYTDSYLIRAYARRIDKPDESQDVDSSASVTISTTIPKILEISLLPPGGSFDPAQTSRAVDFGSLSDVASVRALDLRVRTNAGYAISLSSQNNGMLKRGGSSAVIPYLLLINGIPMPLIGSSVNPVQVAVGSGQTSTSGAVKSLAFVTSASTSSALAGSYQDTITVTVATTD